VQYPFVRRYGVSMETKLKTRLILLQQEQKVAATNVSASVGITVSTIAERR
jgi:hypothetical protein